MRLFRPVARHSCGSQTKRKDRANTITARVTDGSSPPLTATRSLTIVVREVNSPPVLGAITPQTALESQLLRFMVTAQDPDLPANELAYSLEPSSVAGARIDAKTGQFSWTPGPLDAGSTNSFIVVATDNGPPPLSHTATFTVIVVASKGPKLLGTILPDGEFELMLNGDTGKIYLIQASTDLIVWEPVTNILSTATTLQIREPAASTFRQRFYRVISP